MVMTAPLEDHTSSRHTLHSMDDLLFIYGTLLPGHAPDSMANISRNLQTIAPARVNGLLYDLGPYPAASVGSDRFIEGELVEVGGDATWRLLDEYEGCPRPDEGDGLFRRIRTVATLKSGEAMDCWI